MPVTDSGGRTWQHAGPAGAAGAHEGELTSHRSPSHTSASNCVSCCSTAAVAAKLKNRPSTFTGTSLYARRTCISSCYAPRLIQRWVDAAAAYQWPKVVCTTGRGVWDDARGCAGVHTHLHARTPEHDVAMHVALLLTCGQLQHAARVVIRGKGMNNES